MKNNVYICIHISPYLFPLLSPTLPLSLSHPSSWSQSTELISLCYATASHQLSILHLVVYIKNGHEEPRGKTGIKTQTYQRMDLRTQGGGRVSWDKVREWHGHIYTTKCKTDSQWEAAAQHREISSVLVTTQRGGIGRVGGRETQKGRDMVIYVYV